MTLPVRKKVELKNDNCCYWLCVFFAPFHVVLVCLVHRSVSMVTQVKYPVRPEEDFFVALKSGSTAKCFSDDHLDEH